MERVQERADCQDDQLLDIQPRRHLRLRVGQEDECASAIQTHSVLVIKGKQLSDSRFRFVAITFVIIYTI